MHLLPFVTALIFTAAASTARAEAIYTWVNNSSTGGAGTLTLSDDVYFAGGASGELTPYEGKIWFMPPTAGVAEEVDVAPMTVQVWIPTPGAPLSMDIGPPWNPYIPGVQFPNSSLRLDFSLTVVGDGLEGFLSFQDGYGDAFMDGSAGSWGNFQATTDLHPTGCRSDTADGCDTLGGRWLLTSAPTRSVPEPFAAGLLLIGLAALGAARRRARVSP